MRIPKVFEIAYCRRVAGRIRSWQASAALKGLFGVRDCFSDGAGRRLFKWIALLAVLLVSDVLHANPTGGHVSQGSATFSTSGSQFTINQSSASAVINWQTFNIGVGETTTFNQPSANSVAWNQINDVNPSQILGNLNANGLIVLQNANGFYVGGQAAITTHGLIMTTASTPALDLSSGGPWSFNTPPPTAKIVNYGKINVVGGGPAFLIASDIENGGTISAPGGKIGLYAGETVLVSTAPDGRGLSAKVTLPEGSVDNEGRLIADAGSIAAQAQMVNQNGLIQANSVRDVNGTIELVASDAVKLGANSVISAQGDAQGVSSGGSVTVKGGQSFSDQVGSTIDIAGGVQGGTGGQAEISAPEMGNINTMIDGHAADGFAGGILGIDPLNIWLAPADSAPNAPSDYTVVNVNSFSGMSQISLQADNNISLNTAWSLADQSAPATLSLSAGNDITFALYSGINAGRNWSVNLAAGTSFVPSAGQPTPASGSDGIYLYGGSPNQFNSSYIHTQNGDINLWAANEVQVGWSGSAASRGRVNSGSGAVTTTGGGSISVTTLYGDVNSGSNPAGYTYVATAPYFKVDPNLGGISTAAGGNLTINAGRDVISYLPSGNGSTAAGDGGSGAFGSQSGNVTITAAGNIYGHYVVANGVGTVTAGGDVGAANGDPFALSLVSGGWNVNAPNGDIYLQEVRNPNGVFNNKSSRLGSGQFLFDYDPQSYVDLSADGVFLTGGIGNVPRPFGGVPVLYPPILDINAGAGGVTLDGTVTLYPSPYQNLQITTTDGGNLAAGENTTGVPYELLMSDSAQNRWINSATFSDSDHGTLQNEPNEDTPVLIDISGSMENLNLITTKVTDITVGGDIINCGFSGQNLRAGDHTMITVGGQIFYNSSYSFFALNQPLTAIPTGDLPAGYANSWDLIFTLAVQPDLLASFQIPPYVTGPQRLAYILQNCSLFGEETLNGRLIGFNPGFVYDPTSGQLGFAGPMLSSTLAALTQPLTILHLVNGQPVIDTNPNDHSAGRTYGQLETDTISWASSSAVQSLYADSQGRPSLNSHQLGLQIGGPGWFDINAGSISLGNSSGILSCGVVSPLGRYGNLTSITPAGANVDVNVAGNLDMLTSDIAAVGGGDVNVISTGGSMDLGSPYLFANTSGTVGAGFANGIFTTGGGDVNVTALGDVNIDGSRIATYNGGDIFVESLQGNVNVGNGRPIVNTVYVSYVDPGTGEAVQYPEAVYGAGIIANTLVPPVGGESFPSDAAKLPGNITVKTPQGDITAGSSGITQVALDGSVTAGPTITLTAGSPGYTGNIDLGDSGVIGGTVNLSANGNITGQIVSRQNSTVNAAGNFGGTLLSGGSAAVSGGGTISGTIIGVGGVSVAGVGGVTASVLGQNVSVNGGAAQNTLGTATATASTQAAGAQTSQNATEQVASNLGDDKKSDDDKKKKKKATIRRVPRVTVILPKAS